MRNSVFLIPIVAVFCLALGGTAGADEPGKGFVNASFTDETGETVRYVVFIPRSYDGKTRFPVIMFLHGGGELKPIPWGLGTYIHFDHEYTFDFIAIFPHTDDEKDRFWSPDGPGGRRVMRALDEVEAHYKTDPRRVYLTGFSVGGIGTWELGATYPERFAALAPVAGRSWPFWAAKVKDIPVWAFNGADDEWAMSSTAKPGQPPDNAPAAIALLKKLGAHPKYSEFPGVGHVPDGAYQQTDLYAWFKKQRKNAAIGDWRLVQPTVGESILRIVDTGSKLEVREVGNGNAKSTTASCEDGLLVIHWEVHNDLRGYWVLNLNKDYTKGNGRTIFVQFKDFEPGEPGEIEGRKVRIVEGVTIDRVDPDGI